MASAGARRAATFSPMRQPSAPSQGMKKVIERSRPAYAPSAAKPHVTATRPMTRAKSARAAAPSAGRAPGREPTS